MNYFILSTIFLFVTITLSVIMGVLANKDVYTDVTDSLSCTQKLDKDAKTCGKWKDDICLKGTCDTCQYVGGDCTQKNDYLLVSLSMVTVVTFIVFIVLAVLGFTSKR